MVKLVVDYSVHLFVIILFSFPTYSIFKSFIKILGSL